MKKVYAVRKGRNPGIYYNYDDCCKQVSYYPNAEYKSYLTEKEAQEYLGDGIEIAKAHNVEYLCIYQRGNNRIDPYLLSRNVSCENIKAIRSYFIDCQKVININLASKKSNSQGGFKALSGLIESYQSKVRSK